MDSLFRWVAAGIFLITSPFTAIGAYEAYQTRAELHQSLRLPGTVIGNRSITEHRDGVEEHAYQPEVSFRSPDGVIHHFADPAASLPPDYAVGAPVAVLYNPAAPQKMRIASWKRLWLVPSLLVVVGLLPGAVAWLVMRRISRASARPPAR
jgi:hypothetical protein